MIALFRAELHSRRRSLLAFAAGCFLLLLVLAGTYSAYGGSTGFAHAFGSGHAPRLFSAISGSATADIFTPANFLAFGFVHPLFLVLTLGTGISIGVAAVATDVETGRSELLFTAPVSPVTILRTRFAAWFAAQILVLAAAVAGALLGSRLSGSLSAVSPAVPIRVALQFLCLAFFVASVAFAASCFTRTRGAAMGVAVGVTAAAYVVNLIALLWHPLSFARHLTPFGYYSPTDAVHHLEWADAGVLVLGGIVLLAAGRIHLLRRDLA